MSDSSTPKKTTTIRNYSGSSLESPVSFERLELESANPYCVLPPQFFERALKALKDEGDVSRRALFRIETWDGRNVMKLEVARGE